MAWSSIIEKRKKQNMELVLNKSSTLIKSETGSHVGKLILLRETFSKWLCKRH